MTNEEYVKNDGMLCPFCKGTNVGVTSPTYHLGNSASAYCECPNCSRRWQDLFKLVGFEAEEEE